MRCPPGFRTRRTSRQVAGSNATPDESHDFPMNPSSYGGSQTQASIHSAGSDRIVSRQSPRATSHTQGLQVPRERLIVGSARPFPLRCVDPPQDREALRVLLGPQMDVGMLVVAEGVALHWPLRAALDHVQWIEPEPLDEPHLPLV